MMLELARVEAAYGHARALHGIDLVVDEGEVVCIVGRNGAGKTSTLRSIVQDLITVTGGSVRFGGEDLVGLAPHEVVRRGIGYVPEDRRVFASLTVTENLTVPRSFAGAGAGAGYWTPRAGGRSSFRPSPSSRGAARGKPERRPAANAEHRAFASHQPADAPPRRAARRARPPGRPGAWWRPSAASSRSASRCSSPSSSSTSSTRRRTRLYVVDRGRIVFSGTVAEFDADEEIARRYLMVAG